MKLFLTLLSIGFAVGGPNHKTLAMQDEITPANLPSFYNVYENPATNQMWAIMNERHSSGKGWKIAELDRQLGVWRVDTSQPKGSNWYGLALDSNGLPAFASAEKPRFIWQKSSDRWKETFKVCSLQVAFGANNTLYRLGCDRLVYSRQPGYRES